jgi:hypothetical protein
MTRTSLLACALLSSAATPAWAQTMTGGDDTLGAHRQESSRNWIFELKLGFYHPNVDAEPGADDTFDQSFGSKNQLFTQATIEKILFREFGSLSLGLGVGYAEFYGHAVFTNAPSQTSSDSISFHTVPMWLQASYRFDWAARHLNIPIVPYGTLGSGYSYWWTTGSHSGARAGYLAAAGAQLLLNPLDPELARDFDEDSGINDTYLFVEYSNWTVKGGLVPGTSSPGFDLSDHVVSFGIALEF